jgi:hypothetical protein
MDILIGRIEPVTLTDASQTRTHDHTVEGRVLAIRPSRAGRQGPDPAQVPPEQRRRKANAPLDPPGSKVLTLLVPDPANLPADLDRGGYRVVVRFIRQT